MPCETLTTLYLVIYKEGANSCSLAIMKQISQNINLENTNQNNLSPLTSKTRGDFFCLKLWKVIEEFIINIKLEILNVKF
jgi:hypothetical protein